MKKGFEECISKDKDAAPGVVVGAGFGKVENVEVDDVEYINAVCAVMKEYGYTSYEEAIAKIKLDMAKAYAVEATKDFAKMDGIKSTPVEIETNWIGEAAKATGNFLFRVGKRLGGRALEDIKSITKIPATIKELPNNAYTMLQFIGKNGITGVATIVYEDIEGELRNVYDTICEGTADEIADVVGDMIYTTAGYIIPTNKMGKVSKATRATSAAKVVGKVEDISDFSKDVKNASAFAQTAQNAAQKINRFSDVVETSQNLQEYADRMESESGSYSLLPGEGEIGTYRDLLDAGEVGDNITPHHMPSAEYMAQHGVGKKDGLCMNMEMPSPGTGGRHRLTDTYGRNMTDAEKAYYYSLSPRDALAYDIANMRQIYQSQGLYSEIRPKLQEYIKQYKELMPELFDK